MELSELCQVRGYSEVVELFFILDHSVLLITSCRETNNAHKAVGTSGTSYR